MCDGNIPKIVENRQLPDTIKKITYNINKLKTNRSNSKRIFFLFVYLQNIRGTM